jgi:hypothetical protein
VTDKVVVLDDDPAGTQCVAHAGAAAALMAGIPAICGPDVCPLVVPGNIGTDDTLARVARFLTGRT